MKISIREQLRKIIKEELESSEQIVEYAKMLDDLLQDNLSNIAKQQLTVVSKFMTQYGIDVTSDDASQIIEAVGDQDTILNNIEKISDAYKGIIT